MTLIDHIFAILLLLGACIYPLLDGIKFKARLIQLGEYPNEARLKLYRELMVFQWLLTATLIGFWIYQNYAYSALGFRFENKWSFWSTSALALFVAYFYVATCLQMMKDTTLREKIRHKFAAAGETNNLLPKNSRELKYWIFCSISTLSEEIVFRGFVLWYVTGIANFVLACILSCILFAIPHAYQGRKGIIQTGIFGAVMLFIYIISGSIWLAIMLHIVQDIFGGVAGYLSLGARDRSSSDQALEHENA